MKEERVKTLADFRSGDTISTNEYHALIGQGGRFADEARFQEWVRHTAVSYGWMYYHPHDSRHGAAGYPDMHIINGPHEVFAELKLEGKKPTAEQRDWLNALQRRGRGQWQHTCLWVPSMEQAICAYLTVPQTGIPPGIWVPKDTP